LLDKLKNLGFADEPDDVLTAYLDAAKSVILNRRYPFGGIPDDVTDVPAQYKSLQCDIAAFLLNKRGAEGQTAHGENGIERAYENGYVPESYLTQIIPCVGVIR
jgi:hypothetical protein